VSAGTGVASLSAALVSDGSEANSPVEIETFGHDRQDQAAAAGKRFDSNQQKVARQPLPVERQNSDALAVITNDSCLLEKTAREFVRRGADHRPVMTITVGEPVEF
jgi:hypothetical protein